MSNTEIIEHIADIKEFGNEIHENLPYVGYVVKAYNLVRKKRMERFFKTLDNKVGSWSETEQKRFKKYAESDIGQQFLLDYADTVLLTSSKISHAALALLYSDIDHTNYSVRFKTRASQSLRGCTDLLINIFLLLLSPSLNLKRIEEGPYPICFIREQDVKKNLEFQNLIDDASDFLIDINDLTRRGLISPDHARVRLGENEWSYPYGISQKSEQYFKLQTDAKKLIESWEL